jgi:hypothetical protein
MKSSEAFASTDSKESRFAPDPLRFLIARIRSFVRREGTVVFVIRDRASLLTLAADTNTSHEHVF